MPSPTRIIVGDLVLMEVLRGARDERHAESLERAMRRFRVEPMVDVALALAAARHSRFLRGRGVTIRKTVDLLIATFCIERGHALLHQDRDFDRIAQHLPLAIA
jgi:predicted nucleic acid-binding protein